MLELQMAIVALGKYEKSIYNKMYNKTLQYLMCPNLLYSIFDVLQYIFGF